jgi:alkylation response protein AidB-like acyl-CoA dehydrogenase
MTTEGLLVSEEQRSLAEAARDWFGRHVHLDRPRNAQRPLWTSEELAGLGELGVLGLLRPADGGSHADLSVVIEEAGRAGASLPIAAAAMACAVLDASGLAGGVGEELASGAALCVPVLPEPGEPAIDAKTGGSGELVVHGRAAAVPAGQRAQWLLVPARAADGMSALALVPADHTGVRPTERTTLDLTREFAQIELDGATLPAGAWIGGEPAAALTELLADASAVYCAADAVARLLAATVDYVRTRTQFGQVIGSFQAVKHHCANMALDVEAARAAVRGAVLRLGEPDQRQRAVAASVAASFAGEACSRAAGTALQLHGGIGFTWEHDLHLFLRRIKTDELLGGAPRWHRDRLLRLAD